MTPPDFSVLLLAWDDADPSVAVLGGGALPPTLPLVYQLATQQSVVAVYPHLPAEDLAATEPAQQPAAASDGPAPAGASEIEEPLVPADEEPATPGIRILPGPQTEGAKAAAYRIISSRIIGLEELPPDASAPLPLNSPASVAPAPASAAPGASQGQLAARSQWPTGANAPRLVTAWAVPAAPYAGTAAANAFIPPAAPVSPGATVREAAALAAAAERLPSSPPPSSQTLRPRTRPQAGDLNFDPDPELPAVVRPSAFDEPTEELGSAEAAAMESPELASAPAAPGPGLPAAELTLPPAPPEPEALPEPVTISEPLPHLPVMDGLNYRMIQYARKAAHLVLGRNDFSAIYAPNWPAWLAALEIRNSTGVPLVLYATSMAADFARPAERGWLLEVERMAVRRARLILVPNEAMQQRMRAQFNGAIGELRVVDAADEAALRQILAEIAGA